MGVGFRQRGGRLEETWAFSKRFQLTIVLYISIMDLIVTSKTQIMRLNE